MLPYRDSKLTLALLAVFFALALGYALFEARGQIFGPTITVSGELTEVHSAYVLIQGKASRISSLSMNGQRISVTEDGAFSQPYLLAPGQNRIVLDAEDSYGRKAERVVNVLYVPNGAGISPSAQAGAGGQATGTAATATSGPQVAPGQ